MIDKSLPYFIHNSLVIILRL